MTATKAEWVEIKEPWTEKRYCTVCRRVREHQAVRRTFTAAYLLLQCQECRYVVPVEV